MLGRQVPSTAFVGVDTPVKLHQPSRLLGVPS
jgi:hypothetical protein